MLALPALFALAALLVACGLVYGGKAFTDALVWIIHKTTGRLPIIGGILSAPAAHALQKLSNALGGLADSLGGDIAASWHYLAVIVDRVGWTIFHLSLAVERLMWQITVGYPLHLLWQRAQDAYRLAKLAGHTAAHSLPGTKIIQRFVTYPARSPLASAIRAVTRPLAAELHAFERWTRHAIAASGGAVYDVTVQPVRVGVTAKQLRRLGRRVSKLEGEITGLAAVAVVATALARMRLSWLRCDALRRIGNKHACNGFRSLEKILDSLLGLAIDALVITDLCAITKLLTEVAQDFEPVLVQMTSGIVDLMDCQGSSRPPALHVNAVDLPPVTAFTLGL